eukprot:gene3697-biopygen7141
MVGRRPFIRCGSQTIPEPQVRSTACRCVLLHPSAPRCALLRPAAPCCWRGVCSARSAAPGSWGLRRVARAWRGRACHGEFPYR